MTTNNLIECPKDADQMGALSQVMRSIPKELRWAGPNPYQLFSNAVLGERVMQISEEVQMIEGIRSKISEKDYEDLLDLLQEASFIGVEIKMCRKDV